METKVSYSSKYSADREPKLQILANAVHLLKQELI